MSKRFLSIILAALMVLAACMPAAMAEDESSDGEGYYYVYTENGKSLNVRSTPGGTVVGSLKYGARIHVDAFVDSNWALILYRYNQPGYGTGEYAAFVNRRFLTKNKPAARPSASRKTASESAPAADPLAEINKEFKSAKRVTPYKVTVRPTRVSGWVNLRWAPSKSSELMATYKANDQLMVIREMDNWLQVEDMDTGDVGFISRQFVTQ